MTEINLKTALNRELIESKQLRILLPRTHLRFKIKVARLMWNQFSDIKKVGERSKAIEKYFDGLSQRTLDDYRRADFKVQNLKQLPNRKVDETSQETEDFKFFIKDSSGKTLYFVTVTPEMVASMEDVMKPVEPMLKPETVKEAKVAIQTEKKERSEQYVNPIDPDDRIELARAILTQYATGLLSLADACERNNVSPMDFHHWMLLSREIKLMYSEASQIATFLNTEQIQHLANQRLINILEAGSVTNVKTHFELVKTPHNPQGEFQEVKKTEDKRAIRPSELAMLKRIISSDLNLSFAGEIDEVEKMSNEELMQYIQEQSS